MRWLAVIAAVIAALTDILYFGVVVGQGGHDPIRWRVAFVATFIAVLTMTAALSALAIFVGGFEASERAIACAPTEGETASGSGLLSGPYHYTCVNGKLTIYPGACHPGAASYDASGNVTSVSTC